MLKSKRTPVFDEELLAKLDGVDSANEFVDAVFESRLKLIGANDSVLDEYKGAFKMSLAKNSEEPSQLHSYADIVKENDINRMQVKQHAVCLRTTDARVFLSKSLGLKNNRFTNLTYDAYVTKFNRCPGTIDNGQLFLTYVEWLVFADYNIELTLPKMLRE